MDADTVARLLAEGPLPVSRAAGLVPSTRGRKRHASTLVRWIVSGKGGLRLEGFKDPTGAWFTSAPALSRFLAALSAIGDLVAAPRPARELQRRAAEAVARLRGR
jgi:hypothetical protein